MKNLIVILSLMIIDATANVNIIDTNDSVEMNNSKEVDDRENFSLALSEKNLKYCSIIVNKDKKIECFGIVKRNSGYCNMIENSDLKKKCLSVALSDSSLCNKIENKDLESECKDLER